MAARRRWRDGAGRGLAVLLFALLSLTRTAADTEDRSQPAREAMISDIRATADAVGSIAGRRGFAPETLAVMAEVPRHLFVPPDRRDQAYENRPLPIGYGQTISQPYIVALMTDLLASTRAKVLEVGTGSGYQAAILSRLGARVFSIEIIPALAETADLRLRELGYPVSVRTGDGYYGWPEEAPFDRIIVTAAASHIPPPLIAQLKPEGRILIPVGGPFAVQELLLVEKAKDGRLSTRSLLPVRFVPLTGGR